MRDVFDHMVRLLDQGESFVLATIFSCTGSAPRTAGARMLVRADGSIVGTIGGGLLEARVQQTAPQVFQNQQACVKAFNLTSKDASQMDMICGGQVEVLVDFIDAADDIHRAVYPALLAAMEARQRAWLLTAIPNGGGKARRCVVKEDGTVIGEPGIVNMVGVGNGSPIGLFGAEAPGAELPDIASSRYPVLIDCEGRRLLVEPIHNAGTVYIFGAGHISQRLAPLAGMVGFQTVVLDDRPEFANWERFDAADRVIVIDSFEGVLDGLPMDHDSYLVIVTRGHVHDKTILAQALRTEAGYIGMIGSHKKRDATYSALIKEEGFRVDDFARVHSPIGLAIGAESPEEIAVCIVAELIRVRAEAR